MDREEEEKSYINAYGKILVPYCSKLHTPPTNYRVLAAQWEPYKKKSLTLNPECLENFLEKSQNRSSANNKTKRARGLGRTKTREEMGKGKQMTALRFQTGRLGSDIPGIPSTNWSTAYCNITDQEPIAIYNCQFQLFHISVSLR